MPYGAEQQALREIEAQEQATRAREQLEMRIAEARDVTAKPGAPEAITDNGRLRMELGDQHFPEAVEAEARLSMAHDLGTPKVPEIDVAQAGDATKQALEQEGLLDRPLKGRQAGDDAEKYARTVLEKEGLPNADGHREHLLGVTEGQFSGTHGIDLIGVSEKHSPVPIEVKEVQQGQADLRDRPLTSVESKDGTPVKQMDDTWTRDRYRRLIENPEKRKELWEQGVGAKYLNPRNFARDDAKLWSDILPEKTVATVSPQGDKAVGTTLLEQARDRNVGRIVSIKTLA